MIVRGVLVAVVTLALLPATARGQDPGAELPDTASVELPAHVEHTLANGLRLVVVPDSTAEAAVYTLLVPGGSSADRPGREGTSSVLAGIIQRESGGAPALAATASTDAMALSVVDSARSPTAVARRLRAALLEAPVTDEGVGEVRAGRIEAAREELARPDVAATRVLARAVYGDHPYGRSASPSSLATVTAEDVRAWREAHLRPGGAVLAASGPVDPDAVRAAVASALSGWSPARGSDANPVTRPPGGDAGGRRILVHRPGLPRALVLLGTDLPRADHPDWTPLAVLERTLTGDPSAPLTTVRPPGAREGIVVGTSTSVRRRRGPGIFQAGAAVPVGLGPEVVAGLLAAIARTTNTFVSPSLVRPVRDELVREFRRQAGDPRAGAALMAVNRILGLPDSLMTSYPRRVMELGPQTLREVAARHLDTARVSVVVVGDATLLLEDLEELGGWDLRDARGLPLRADALEALEERADLDALALAPMELRYAVRVPAEDGGSRGVGTVSRTLEAGPDSVPGTMVFRSRAELDGRDVSQSVTFTVSGFDPVAARYDLSVEGRPATLELAVREGRLRGTLDPGSGERRPVDVALPPGALLGDMVELAAWLVAVRAADAPSDSVAAYRFTVVEPQSGSVGPVVMRVGPEERVEVPAGSFRARRVEVGGDRPQSLWIRVEGTPVPLRIVPYGRPVSLDLLSVRPAGGEG